MSTNVLFRVTARWQRFTVVVTVPREAGDGPLVPQPAPAIEGVAVVWLADKVVVGVTIDAEDETVAKAARKAVAALLLGACVEDDGRGHRNQ